MTSTPKHPNRLRLEIFERYMMTYFTKGNRVHYTIASYGSKDIVMFGDADFSIKSGTIKLNEFEIKKEKIILEKLRECAMLVAI